MQTIAQNFVAGVILLVERSIRPRDVLEVDGRVVRVEEMGLRSTIVRTWDDEDLIVPNRLLSENAVKNFTSRDRLCRVACSVGVSYDSDMALVERVLFEAGASLEGRVIEKNPVVLLTGFGDSAVNWRVHVWTNRPWTQPKVRSDLNKSVWWALKRAGIEIPFPQLDVHVDTPPKERLLG
jgi:small-conductance mechanosensitive channel